MSSFTRYLSLVFLFLLGICFAPAVSAQISIPAPDEESFGILEQINFSNPGVLHKSRGKGVELRYEIHGPYEFRPKTATAGEAGRTEVASYEEFVGKFKIPILNKPNVKLLLGYEYVQNEINFSQIGDVATRMLTEIDGRSLRTNKFSVYLTKSWDERYYSLIRARISTTGDYTEWVNFDKKYHVYTAAAVFGKKVNPDTEWGVGITYTQNDLRTLVLPFGVYNHNFNDKWGLETVIPVQAFLRRNFSEHNILMVGGRYDSRLHYLAFDNVRDADLTPYYLRQGNIRAEALWEHQLVKWVWAYANAGVAFPIQSRFESPDPNIPDIEMQTGMRPFFRIGIFLSPPDDMIK